MMEYPKTLLEAIQYFSDEQVCIDLVAAMKWLDGKPVCPNCGGIEHYYLKTQRRWKCRNGKCGKQFSVKVNTIFEDSPVSLQKWLPAMWLLANCKNGISSWELHRALGVTQKTAWFMLQRIRLAFKNGIIGKLGSGSGPVEVDETYIGPKPQKMHRARRLKMQSAQNGQTKTVVMGMLDRDSRQVRAKVIPNVRRDVLQREILDGVENGSTVYTDGYSGYDQLLLKGYLHQVINHTQEYVRGQVSTQGIDNFWSTLKRGLTGTYIAVEPFHLDRYVDEQAFRYNNRATKDNPLTDRDRFLLAVSQIAGKRLTYAELTGKVAEQSQPF
jgi:transposase-like protein